MKNTIMLIVLLLISVQVNAENELYSTSTIPTTSEVDEYTKYLNLFREEFKSELLKGEFARIDQKIKGYEGDIAYISSEKGSQYAGNLDIYKTKLKALQQVRQEYISYYKEVKTNVVEYTKEQLMEKEKMTLEAKEKAILEAKKKAEELREKAVLEAKQRSEEYKEKAAQVKEKTLEQTKKLSNIELLKQKKAEIIAKHKEQFSKRLEKTIENLNTTQLEKALARVNEQIEKNSSREVVLVQLIALKDLIEEKIAATEEIDIEAIFKGL
ncbi:MAG: hypothetical protein PHI37_01920 [Candidatus Gracilibacteria bacterium]|nr:hypothetical protein [Candidatus Gracilibacteria bacterium]